MNIGLITTRLFDVPGSGGEVNSHRLLQQLAQAGHGVQLIGRGQAATVDRRVSVLASSQLSVGPTVQAFDGLARSRQWLELALALASGEASTMRRLAAGDVGRRVAGVLRKANAPVLDMLWLDHLHVLPWVSALRRRLPPPVVVMHNIESEVYTEQAEQLRGRGAGQAIRRAVLRREARLLRQWEQRMLAQAAAVVCVSDSDADRLRHIARQCGASPYIAVLPAFPLRNAAPAAARPRSALQRIGMLGTWTWGPNRHALQWMLDQVLPLLPAHCELVLAGSGLDRLALPAKVKVLGRVADVHSFYNAVDLVAIPALIGSGVQEKAVEAIGMAKPVVASAHALRGLQPDLPPTVQVADSATEFARLCGEPPTLGGHHQRAISDWSLARQQRYQAVIEQCHHAAGLRQASRGDSAGARAGSSAGRRLQP